MFYLKAETQGSGTAGNFMALQSRTEPHRQRCRLEWFGSTEDGLATRSGYLMVVSGRSLQLSHDVLLAEFGAACLSVRTAC